MKIKVGDKIGYIFPKNIKAGEEYLEKYSLIESEVYNITETGFVKTDRFYALDQDELDTDTKMMEGDNSIIIMKRPFVLTEAAREKAECWIRNQNEIVDRKIKFETIPEEKDLEEDFER